MTKILLVDEDSSTRTGLRTALNNKGFQVLEAKFGSEAVTLTAEHPDVIVMDGDITDMPVIDAIGMIIEQSEFQRIIILSSREDPDTLDRACRLGVRGYILKENIERTMGVVDAVLQGAVVIDTRAAQALVDRPLPPPKPILKERERKALQHAANGLTLQQSADELYLSVWTVKTHLKDAVTQMGANNRAHAVALALHHHLIRIEE